MESDIITSPAARIWHKGTAEPKLVRFHIPTQDQGWKQVTWGELLDKSTKVALFLDNLGVGTGNKVSVYATTRHEWAYCTCAIEVCRAIFVPVYFSNTPDQTRYVINHSDSVVLFTEMALLPNILLKWHEYPLIKKLVVWDFEGEQALGSILETVNQQAGSSLDASDLSNKLISLKQVFEQGEVLLSNKPHDWFKTQLDLAQPEDDACIIYTSGTTGTPKGVVLNNLNLASSFLSWIETLEHAFPEPGERRDIMWLPISHMAGLGMMNIGTCFEYETWVSDPYKVLEVLPIARPTFFLSVPAYWEKMYSMALSSSDIKEQQHAKLIEITGGAMQFVLSGGAGLKKEVKEFFHKTGIPMIEGYGLTECSPNLTMNRLDDFDLEAVGKSMPGVRIKIADDGEILAKGKNVFNGYYKDPVTTRECFDNQGWFMTGDLGEFNRNGFLVIKGRKKEIIVTSGGKNIGPAGIEGQFLPYHFIEHVVVYGNEKKYLTAFITLNEDLLTQHLANQDLPRNLNELVKNEAVIAAVQRTVDEVNSNLASYQTIKKFYLHDSHLSVEGGHLTPSFKLRRTKVWEAYHDNMDALYEE